METEVKDGVAHVKLTRWLTHGKEWIARVSGRDPKYGFTRDFVSPSDRNWSRSGKNGDTRFKLTRPGIYQVSDPGVGQYGKEGYKYITFDGKDVVVVSRDKFTALAEQGGAAPVPAPAKAPAKAAGAPDKAVAPGDGVGAAKKAAGNGSGSAG